MQASIAAQPTRVRCPARAAPAGAAQPLTALPRTTSCHLRNVSARAVTSPTDQSASGGAAGIEEDTNASTLILGNAINVASAAVQSYVTPTTGQKYRNCGSNGTTMQFLDTKGFVAERLGHLLKVTVTKCSGFKSDDFMSKPDLYVEVTAGESCARTPAAPNTSEPSFLDNPLIIYPNLPRSSTLPTDVPPLTVRVFDDDSFVFEKVGFIGQATERLGVHRAGDDALGSATIELGDGWESKGTTEHKVEVRKKDGQVMGTVAFKMTPLALGKKPKETAETADDDAGEGCEAADAFKNPDLAVAAGVSKKMQDQVASATVLRPVAAAMGADASAAGVKDTGATALPGALKAAAKDTPLTGADAGDITMGEAKQRVQEAWVKLQDAYPDAFLVGGEPVAYIDSEYDTQVWVHCNKEQKKMIIAFRGTEFDNGWDWMGNAMGLLKSVTKDPETSGLRTTEDLGGDCEPVGDAKVHFGFYKGYRSVEPQIRQMIAMCTGGEEGWEITTTGHSLGGALATACAYDLVESKDIPYPVDSFTFGSPRTGNSAWTELYDKIVPETFRFHNHNDGVAQFPPFGGYRHVKCQSRLDSYVDDKGVTRGLLFMPENNPVSVFGGSTVSPKIRAELKAEPGARDKIRLFKRQLSLFSTIFSGRAAADHDFDVYMLNLSRVMYTASSGKHREATRALRDALEAMNEASAAQAEATA